MKVTVIAPLLLAAAAALGWAPASGADTGCDGTGLSACQQTGQAASVSTAGDSSPGDPADWPFRAGADQPVWVLD